MRNAFSGYTYQQYVTFLLLSIMDVERSISLIEIEAKTYDKFDDLVLTTTELKTYQLQIKDFEEVNLEDLEIQGDGILIKKSLHKLSSNHNIIFFKYILIEENDEILNFPCFNLSDNISIISLSRVQAIGEINNLYEVSQQRKNEMEVFFSWILDTRTWKISIESLPQLKVFKTELQERSVLVTNKILEFDRLLLIEGKPGVGKSHFANTLIEEYENNIVYRFWIGNQDADYEERLKFKNFKQDLNIKLFNDQKERPLEELYYKLKEENRFLIIDGVDHVENYNNSELNYFIDFINGAKTFCKVIILSRPLVKNTGWEKFTLHNWSLDETEKVLDDLFHLTDYSVVYDIYRISQGYPIIVKYLAEHYKINKIVPVIEQVDDINSYYQGLISNENGKYSLSVFLCTNSFLMISEIALFIGNEEAYVKEFIKEHPYLFDITLNRISLYHDSFNTFLRSVVEYRNKIEKVRSIVGKSILNLESRFLSRFALFQLSDEQKSEIFIKYASIKTFNKIIKNTIDFESITIFYAQLRESLRDIAPSLVSINRYYDFSLIINIVNREYLSADYQFYYTYVKALITNGITDEEITSSKYLFGMYYYLKTRNASSLFNVATNDHFDTNYFYNQLEDDISEEENYISKHNEKLSKEEIEQLLSDPIEIRDNVIFIIENFYINEYFIEECEALKTSFEYYVQGNYWKSISTLEKFLLVYKTSAGFADHILKSAFNNLLSYGYKPNGCKNEYLELRLEQLISKNRTLGSFDLRNKILNYIRLALFEKRTVDLQGIYVFSVKYYQRGDNSLYSLPIALNVLEKENLVSLRECVQLIHEIQLMSERGSRRLLANFIELYSPTKILSFLEKEFNIEELRVEWFKLSVKYINELSDKIYNSEESKLMRYDSSSYIPFEEIENVLYSNRFKRMETTLDLHRMKIRVTIDGKKIKEKFEKTKIIFEVDEEGYESYEENSQKRFDRGVLKSKDRNFIKKEGLSPSDIAKYSDENYSSLSEIEIFKIFDKKEVNDHFKQILFNSLINKTKSINYFYSLYYHPGNVLTMIKLYGNDREFKTAIRSFRKFLKLSMFELKIRS